MCLCVCWGVGLCTWVQYSEPPEEGTKCTEAGVRGGSEPLLAPVLGSEFWSSVRTVQAFNCRVIFSVLDRQTGGTVKQ